MRTLHVTLFVLLAACSSTGDAGGGDRSPSDPGPSIEPLPLDAPGARHLIESNDATYEVVWAADADPIPMGELFALEVRVFRDGAPAADVALHVDARMPAHYHGMNVVPTVTERAPGAFRIDNMLFHMPGHWELYLDLARGPLTERSQSDLEIE